VEAAGHHFQLFCPARSWSCWRLGDKLGRRRTFSIGLALFTASSAACGLAPTASTLVAGRLVQGAGGALLMPNVMSIITVVYTGAERVKALSAYGMVMGLAAVGGQLIGGVLVQANVLGLGWRSCFLINVPIGLTALALAPQLVPESRDPHRPAARSRRDGPGHDRPDRDRVAARRRPPARVAGVDVDLAGDGAADPGRVRGPAAPPRPSRRCAAARPDAVSGAAFSAGLLAQLVFWCGQGSFFLVLALYLQQGRGMTPLHAGLVFTVLAVSYLAASLGAPALATKHGRRVLAIGALVLACGHVLLLLAVADVGIGGSIAILVPGVLLIGTGMGLGITPLATIILSGMTPRQAGSASGALTTMQNVGNALGVAVIGVLFLARSAAAAPMPSS
jgi:MFS family permease